MSSLMLNVNSIKKQVGDLATFVDNIACSNNGTQIPAAKKIVALGDIHGDFEALVYCLFGAGVIDANGRWIGGNTVVVQTGDILDDCREDDTKRSGCYNEFPVDGYDELVILDYLADLNGQAKQHGGRVALCMGNHEFMAIMNHSLSPKYQQRKTREYFHEQRNKFMRPGSRLGKKLACLMNVVVFVGDWVFLHGGLRPSAFDNMNDIITTNYLMGAYMSGDLLPSDANKFLKTIDDDWFFYSRDYSQNMVEDDNGILCNEFKQIRKMLGKPDLRMVVGHSPQHNINSICNIGGKPAVYRIDTSMSRAFGPKTDPSMRVNALIIEGEKIYSMTPQALGKKFRIPHSMEYYNFSQKHGLRISGAKQYNPVVSKSEIREKEMAAREAYLESQEDLDADEAFIYYDAESI